MSVTIISIKNHTYLKYIYTVSALTTLALVALKSTRPDTLSWRWPATASISTALLGLALAHTSSPALQSEGSLKATSDRDRDRDRDIKAIAAKVPNRFIQLVKDIQDQLKDTNAIKKLNILSTYSEHALVNLPQVISYLEGKKEALVHCLKLAPPSELTSLKLPCIDDILIELAEAGGDSEAADLNCSCQIHAGVEEAFTWAVYFKLKKDSSDLSILDSEYAKTRYAITQEDDAPVECFLAALAKLDKGAVQTLRNRLPKQEE